MTEKKPEININIRKDQKIVIDTTFLDVMNDPKIKKLILSPKQVGELYKD